jgi:2-polyprenyl-3-methyl-5-hydroxy-6-metoxy-1,4-benzoquinol methylase
VQAVEVEQDRADGARGFTTHGTQATRDAAAVPAYGGAVTSARYDPVAASYSAGWGDECTDPATAALLALAGRVRGLQVLDVACGHGRVSRVLASRGAAVTGVDISTELLDRAREQERRDPLGISMRFGDHRAVDIEHLAP